jgi:hypothetical protein
VSSVAAEDDLMRLAAGLRWSWPRLARRRNDGDQVIELAGCLHPDDRDVATGEAGNDQESPIGGQREMSRVDRGGRSRVEFPQRPGRAVDGNGQDVTLPAVTGVQHRTGRVEDAEGRVRQWQSADNCPFGVAGLWGASESEPGCALVRPFVVFADEYRSIGHERRLSGRRRPRSAREGSRGGSRAAPRGRR